MRYYELWAFLAPPLLRPRWLHNCVVKGEAWMAHCQQMLVAGDKSMLPDCPRLGIEMVTLCGALRTLAGQDAPSLPKLAAVNDGRLLALRSSLPQIRQDHGLL